MIIFKNIATPLEKQMLGSIIDHQANNVKISNITFDCDTIEDASGNIFAKQCAWYSCGRWETGTRLPMDGVEAWMPLPEPYKEVE